MRDGLHHEESREQEGQLLQTVQDRVKQHVKKHIFPPFCPGKPENESAGNVTHFPGNVNSPAGLLRGCLYELQRMISPSRG